mmetsp:Transcript_4496/g.10458  ORF Transcript_4496/g.10458 Transcript_4496/m.10458 type:complete len:549 (+) Transcript_4496:69-1715(+)
MGFCFSRFSEWTEVNPGPTALPTGESTIHASWKGSTGRKTQVFELLVVACDPRDLTIENRTDLEKRVNDALTSFVFKTSLFSAKRNNEDPYAVRFHPARLDRGDGSVYGFRDEVRARVNAKVLEEEPKEPNNTLVVAYQFSNQPFPRNASDLKKEVARLDGLVEEAFESEPWLKPVTREKKLDGLHADYFPHFENPALEEGLPWQILESQGSNSTLYTSSFCSFESVVHIFEYLEMLMANIFISESLPKAMDAPILIVGAGPAGLLSARKLKKMGYTNITILEKSDRFGGKTKTVKKEITLASGAKATIPCELGTCYLSPGYDSVLHLFEEYDAGRNFVLDSRGDRPLRAIVDVDLARDDEEKATGINMGEWIDRKSGSLGGGIWETLADTFADAKAGVAIYRYNSLHRSIFGYVANHDLRPIPARRPDASLFKQTFNEFLIAEGLEILTAPFTYAYEVQGYGNIENIPAYYGLVWLTPEVLSGVAKAAVLSTVQPGGNHGSVFATTQGWGTLWEKMVAKEEFNIIYNVTISSLSRVPKLPVPAPAPE